MTTRTQPRIAIGLPVYNGARYLAACIDALLAQTLGDFELVLSDNASSDASEEICRAYAARDARIRYERLERNLGAAPNFNRVFERSRAELFKWAAHDDLVAPTFLARCVDALAEHPDAVLAFPKTRHIGPAGEHLEDYDPPLACDAATPAGRLRQLLLGDETLILKCYPVFGLMRRSALAQTRLIQAFNASDKVLLVELALRGGFAQVPELLFDCRQHPESSWRKHDTPATLSAWFDSGAGARFPMPRYRLWQGFRASVARAPLAPGERLACRATLLRWLARQRNWRVIAGELRIRAREARAQRRAARAGA